MNNDKLYSSAPKIAATKACGLTKIYILSALNTC